jgi:hypothetical protein
MHLRQQNQIVQTYCAKGTVVNLFFANNLNVTEQLALTGI